MEPFKVMRQQKLLRYNFFFYLKVTKIYLFFNKKPTLFYCDSAKWFYLTTTCCQVTNIFLFIQTESGRPSLEKLPNIRDVLVCIDRGKMYQHNP